MNVVSSLVKFLVSNKAKKKKQPHEFSNEEGVPKSVSESASLQTQGENNPLLVVDKNQQNFQVTSEVVQSGGRGNNSDTPDIHRKRTDEDQVSQSLQTASEVCPKQNTEENLWAEDYDEKTPAKSAREKELCEWLAGREKKSSARFRRALQGVQESMGVFSSQLEGAKRNMDTSMADLRAQMLSMQQSMAAGIVQRDERIAKLESQNCLLTGNRRHNAASIDFESSHHLPYDCHSVTAPFFVLRPSGHHYPMPDGSFPSYLQPPLHLDSSSHSFV